MKKLLIFNYIFFSIFTIFLPIFGMEETNWKTTTAKKQTLRHHLKFVQLSDSYEDQSSSSTDPVQLDNSFEMLPEEIFVLIFSFVIETGTPKDFNAIAGVDRKWNRIWQDKKLQDLFIIKLSKDISFERFKSAAKKFKDKTPNHQQALTFIQNMLQKTDYFNLQMFYVLYCNNVRLTDILPGASKLPTLQRYAFYIKSGKPDKLIKFINAQKNDPRILQLLNSSIPGDPENRTLFMCTFACPDIIKQEKLRHLFIKHGADVSIQDADGNTVLHYAIIFSVKTSRSKTLFNLLKKLYYAGYDYRRLLSIRNKQGLTPAKLANKLGKKTKQLSKKLSDTFNDIQNLLFYIENNNDNKVGFIFNCNSAGF